MKSGGTRWSAATVFSLMSITLFTQVEVRNEMISIFEAKSGGVFLWLRYAYDSMLLTLTPFNKPFTVDKV